MIDEGAALQDEISRGGMCSSLIVVHGNRKWCMETTQQRCTALIFSAGRLPQRAVLGLEGAEAGHFLHNLVTADIAGAGRRRGAPMRALLTPQGKILFDFFVVRTGDGYLLDCAATPACGPHRSG